jgi:ubiquinol-cytochrome c reductase iron-sulfur subunit
MNGEHVVERQPPSKAAGAGAAVASVGATGCATWAYLEYAGPARPSLLALALSGIMLGLGASILLSFRSAFAFERVEAARPGLAPSGAPVRVLDGARRGALALIAPAAAALIGAALLPLRSLGLSPARVLYATAWRRGVRLLTVAGASLRPQDVAPGSATVVLPEGAGDDSSSPAILVRLRGTGALRAYSLVCTHAGCAVCVFRADLGHLVCPCHHSVFDAADGGRVLHGPASQPLPELPLDVDPDGTLVAGGDFDRPVGPRAG